jgi:hypothetical protein
VNTLGGAQSYWSLLDSFLSFMSTYVVVIDVNIVIDVSICDGCIWRSLQSGPLMA